MSKLTLAVLLAAVQLPGCAADGQCNEARQAKHRKLESFITQCGGMISERVQLRPAGDGSAGYGLFATR